MNNTKIILPVLVLALKIVMKLFVGRRAGRKHYFELLYELPTDIIFLALSFSFVYFFLDEITQKETALIPLILVIISVIVVVISRECRFLNDEKITKGKGALLIFLIIINYAISVYFLYGTSGNLSTDKIVKQVEQNIDIKKTSRCK
jgi:cell division protein FtsL